ncbi:TRAP transporter substrate-binding protein [Shimia aestuarii]|uniref:TRAP-type C4-dicarboxylate transport system, substrate-binding protein n=1 Tax=Shimia aestuarii TaxID=254406 RepID=A0A1I4MDL5_9RHOB|nr:TRAP transporter substrate-binding protein DctP [Shimia aestuarii]SFM01482.1 TRAP-type C4-dicarboxylate transport system, substrate-binding protein [Shimia aestuarii]
MKLTAIAAALVVAGGIAAEAKELRLSAAPPPNSPWGKITMKFVDKLADVSGGELTAKPYLGSKLGGEQDVVKQIARGRIDMGVMSNTAVSLLVPEFGLLASPYAFDTAEQFDCVADNHLLDTYAAEFDAAKVHALSWMEVGYQVIFSKEAIRTPADLSGVKIRTAPSATDTLFIQTAGGTPVPLAPSEAVPALKTGQVSAATQLSVFGVATGYDKVAPQITVTRHQHQVGAVIISQRTWNGLSDQEKAWINEAAPTFLELRAAIRGAEGALLGKAASEGATVIELNDDELKAWKALAPAAQEAILNELGDDAKAKWDAILAAKASCS